MACRVLDVKLISAKDLKKVTIFSKMRVYAIASVSGGDPRMSIHRTHADRHGGRSPVWNAHLRFPIPVAANLVGLALHVLLRAESVFGHRDVGEVFVPLQDLLAGDRSDGGDHRHLSYQVRRPVTGRARGVLHICYKFSDVPSDAVTAAGVVQQPTTSPYGPYVHGSEKPQPKAVDAVTAYPAAHNAAYPPPYPHAVPYAAPYGTYGQQPYGYSVGPSYGYGGAPPVAPYGYNAPLVAPAGRQVGGMGTGLGLGLLGGAVGGMLLGDMLGDAAVDAAYDAGFSDGMGF